MSQPESQDPAVFTPAAIARELGIHTNTVYDWIKLHKVPHRRGSKNRIYLDSKGRALLDVIKALGEEGLGQETIRRHLDGEDVTAIPQTVTEAPPTPRPSPEVAQSAPAPPALDLSEFTTLIRDLTARNERAVEMAAVFQERNRVLEERNRELLLLVAAKEEEPKRPWWRIW